MCNHKYLFDFCISRDNRFLAGGFANAKGGFIAHSINAIRRANRRLEGTVHINFPRTVVFAYVSVNSDVLEGHTRSGETTNCDHTSKGTRCQMDVRQ